MEYLIASWTRGNSRIDFYGKPCWNEKIIISGHINNRIIPEENIAVETRNVHQLLNGLYQKTFRLSDLSKDQKMKIMNTLKDRGLSVDGCIIIIHALP